MYLPHSTGKLLTSDIFGNFYIDKEILSSPVLGVTVYLWQKSTNTISFTKLTCSVRFCFSHHQSTSEMRLTPNLHDSNKGRKDDSLMGAIMGYLLSPTIQADLA